MASKRGARIDIGSIRRRQIVEAAAEAIARRGLHRLSLSQIERRAGMSRGQLTYYFKTKDQILLAVFDHLLDTMCRRNCPGGDPAQWRPGWEAMLRGILEMILEQPASHLEFHCLQFTFLAEIGHRVDFRRRLAKLYEEWRGQLGEQLKEEFKGRPPRKRVSPRALATLVQAVFHGLAVQNAADPRAFEHRQVVELFLDLIGSYLWPLKLSVRGRAGLHAHARAARPRAARLTRLAAGRVSANGERR